MEIVSAMPEGKYVVVRLTRLPDSPKVPAVIFMDAGESKAMLRIVDIFQRDNAHSPGPSRLDRRSRPHVERVPCHTGPEGTIIFVDALGRVRPCRHKNGHAPEPA